jgi:hypothetical protein
MAKDAIFTLLAAKEGLYGVRSNVISPGCIARTEFRNGPFVYSPIRQWPLRSTPLAASAKTQMSLKLQYFAQQCHIVYYRLATSRQWSMRASDGLPTSFSSLSGSAKYRSQRGELSLCYECTFATILEVVTTERRACKSISDDHGSIWIFSGSLMTSFRKDFRLMLVKLFCMAD